MNRYICIAIFLMVAVTHCLYGMNNKGLAEAMGAAVEHCSVGNMHPLLTYPLHMKLVCFWRDMKKKLIEGVYSGNIFFRGALIVGLVWHVSSYRSRLLDGQSAAPRQLPRCSNDHTEHWLTLILAQSMQ